jgi:hypothetical protein
MVGVEEKAARLSWGRTGQVYQTKGIAHGRRKTGCKKRRGGDRRVAQIFSTCLASASLS